MKVHTFYFNEGKTRAGADFEKTEVSAGISDEAVGGDQPDGHPVATSAFTSGLYEPWATFPAWKLGTRFTSCPKLVHQKGRARETQTMWHFPKNFQEKVSREGHFPTRVSQCWGFSVGFASLCCPPPHVRKNRALL